MWALLWWCVWTLVPAIQPAPKAAGPAAWAAVRQRMDLDAAAGRPLVTHVVVALCDNEHQGIAPVPARLGDGQDPRNNLYWGARYGLRGHLTRRGSAWKAIPLNAPPPAGVLERLLLHKRLTRGRQLVDAYILAEAWDGRRIRAATARFLRLGAGLGAEEIALPGGGTILAGGRSHLLVYVGHDGLMDFEAPAHPLAEPDAPARGAAVLACASEAFFGPLLDRAGAVRLLLTTGLLAPEAYLLEALLEPVLGGGTPAAGREAAARAYQRYQKCGLAAARRLFTGVD